MMDGIQLLIELWYAFPLARVVAVSGEKRLLEKADMFNVQGVFEKPFCMKDLVQAVQEIVDSHTTADLQEV